MNIYLWQLCLRLAVACICGAIIGYERSIRQKEAGLRTHIILCLGACLAMIVSKYGFADVKQGSDAGRIAAQVISGVGFLGAGVIFVRGNSVKGLTTAAGIWTTSSVGLAIGAGMYEIGVIASVMIIILQFVLHKIAPASELMVKNVISLVAKNKSDVVEHIKSKILQNNMIISGIKIKKLENGFISVELTVGTYKNQNIEDVFSLILEDENITEFKIVL